MLLGIGGKLGKPRKVKTKPRHRENNAGKTRKTSHIHTHILLGCFWGFWTRMIWRTTEGSTKNPGPEGKQYRKANKTKESGNGKENKAQPGKTKNQVNFPSFQSEKRAN